MPCRARAHSIRAPTAMRVRGCRDRVKKRRGLRTKPTIASRVVSLGIARVKAPPTRNHAPHQSLDSCQTLATRRPSPATCQARPFYPHHHHPRRRRCRQALRPLNRVDAVDSAGARQNLPRAAPRHHGKHLPLHPRAPTLTSTQTPFIGEPRHLTALSTPFEESIRKTKRGPRRPRDSTPTEIYQSPRAGRTGAPRQLEARRVPDRPTNGSRMQDRRPSRAKGPKSRQSNQ